MVFEDDRMLLKIPEMEDGPKAKSYVDLFVFHSLYNCRQISINIISHLLFPILFSRSFIISVAYGSHFNMFINLFAII